MSRQDTELFQGDISFLILLIPYKEENKKTRLVGFFHTKKRHAAVRRVPHYRMVYTTLIIYNAFGVLKVIGDIIPSVLSELV